MHPRNIYRTEPDFKALANKYESFKPFVKEDRRGRSYIQYKDASAVRELTRCLLKDDFNIDIDFPLDSLCPAVPNRLNYLLWIDDILKETMADSSDTLYGIDIGIGASCIYPLLGCSLKKNWHFLGTEIDERSIEYAVKNIQRNHLEDRIEVKHNTDPDKMFLIANGNRQYAFSMCNPPFYSSVEEIEECLSFKESEPSATCQGSTNEMITVGGEYEFIKKMIIESMKLKTRIRWYTSMVGLKRSIRPLLRILKEHGINNYVVTELIQGRTVRWVIGWSFFPEKVIKSKSLNSYRPKCQFDIKLPQKRQFVLTEVRTILSDLEVDYHDEEVDSDDYVIKGTLYKNTWSRAYRRQKKRQKLDTDPTFPMDNAAFK
ncbi:hypothetical protein BDB01DRAFT_852136 [Pilobolus umbonatus]|nr:hypothetical protein BDB01DRAFT_852136 [Pilobolus umbonatus]